MRGRATRAALRGHEQLIGRALDPDAMLAVFQRELPALASSPIRVTGCTVANGGSASHPGRKTIRVMYRVTAESRSGRRWNNLLVGTLPATPDFLAPELMVRCRAAEDHPAVQPYCRLATFVGEVQMALLVFPVDPCLPALAELTGPEALIVLAPYLNHNPPGTTVTRTDWALRRYRPAARCGLRIEAEFSGGNGLAPQRVVQARIFADDRGAALYRNMQSLWAAASRNRCLRLPEPLGYDAERRMLVLAETPEGEGIGDWVTRLQRGAPLPSGIGLDHLERGMTACATALADLQAGDGGQLERERTYRGELARLHRRRAAHRPDDAAVDLIDGALDALGAQPVDDEQLVPAHGRFRPAVVSGDDRSLHVLEWEGLCLAHPALDAASFLGRLRESPLTDPGRAPDLEHLARVFRSAFLELRPDVTRGHLAAYEALELTRMGVRRIRGHGRRRSREEGLRLITEAVRLVDG